MTTSQVKKNSLDLSEGDIFGKLIKFALPILAGQLLQTLYNSVDSIVIGNFVGVNALSAVTASASISMFIAGFFNGLSAGASVLFARHFGAKRYKDLHDAIHTTVLFSVLFGGIVAVIGIIFTPALLSFTKCPADVYADAIIYLRIYLIGVLFTSMYNIAAGVLRSVGDSRHPFYYLALASVMNIVLDILFVAVFKMGVSGVAIATVISQCTSVLLSFSSMMKMEETYRFKVKDLMIDREILVQVLNLGLPAGIQSSITSISNIYIQRYINTFSPAAIAGIGSAMKIDQFAGMPCNALGLAMTTFISQNLGAGKYDRARKGVRYATLIVSVFVIIVSIPIYLNAASLMRIFGSDADMIRYGEGMLKTIMPVYLVMGNQMLYGGIVRGYGYSKAAMILSIMGMVVLRQIWLAISLSMNHVIENIYLGYPIGWAGVLILLLGFYFIVIRKQFEEEK